MSTRMCPRCNKIPLPPTFTAKLERLSTTKSLISTDIVRMRRVPFRIPISHKHLIAASSKSKIPQPINPKQHNICVKDPVESLSPPTNTRDILRIIKINDLRYQIQEHHNYLTNSELLIGHDTSPPTEAGKPGNLRMEDGMVEQSRDGRDHKDNVDKLEDGSRKRINLS